MTGAVGLIGHPLKRRQSPIMHNAAFAHFGIDTTYRLLEIQPGELSGFVAMVRDERWLGFQVTAPYKQAIVRYLDEVEAEARSIGAVNSVVQPAPGKLTGFNTDAPGFRRAAEAELGVDFSGIPAAVAGAGGAARAVVQALVAAGAASVVVGNRTSQRANDLAADFGSAVRAARLGDEFDNALRSAALAVNATTIGMMTEGVPFDVGLLREGCGVFDLVYEPAETELLSRARGRGLAAVNGLGMLVAQAELAFERWTGIGGAGGVMRAVLEGEG